MKKLIFPCT